jgi:hypothetical protein
LKTKKICLSKNWACLKRKNSVLLPLKTNSKSPFKTSEIKSTSSDNKMRDSPKSCILSNKTTTLNTMAPINIKKMQLMTMKRGRKRVCMRKLSTGQSSRFHCLSMFSVSTAKLMLSSKVRNVKSGSRNVLVRQQTTCNNYHNHLAPEGPNRLPRNYPNCYNRYSNRTATCVSRYQHLSSNLNNST